jgi:hypothetical protein
VFHNRPVPEEPMPADSAARIGDSMLAAMYDGLNGDAVDRIRCLLVAQSCVYHIMHRITLGQLSSALAVSEPLLPIGSPLRPGNNRSSIVVGTWHTCFQTRSLSHLVANYRFVCARVCDWAAEDRQRVAELSGRRFSENSSSGSFVQELATVKLSRFCGRVLDHAIQQVCPLSFHRSSMWFPFI